MHSPRRTFAVLLILLATGCRAADSRSEVLPIASGCSVLTRAPCWGSEVSAMARDQSWFAERDTVLTALSRREVQWAAQHPSAYRFRATWATMGEASHVDVVAVAGRPLVICDTLGMPADSETRAVVGLDVPALFESIREALADTTHNVMVQFDPARGFPTYLEIGNRWTSDVGYIRRVEHFRVIDQSQAQCARIKRDAAADAQSYVPLH